jgi:PRD1 phage membrane DNA delivery
MDKEILNSLVAVATAIIGVAIISVIVGSSQTSNIIKTAGSAFSGVLQAAVSPASGGGGIGGSFNPGGGVSSLSSAL